MQKFDNPKTAVGELNGFLARNLPVGTGKYLRLVNCHDNDKFNAGRYTMSIFVPKGDPAGEEIVQAINAAHRAIGGVEPLPVKDGDVQNTRGKTPAPGCWILTVKAGEKTNLQFRDARNQVILADEIEDCDKVRLKIHAFDYTAKLGRPGISLWFKGVQLLSKGDAGFGVYDEDDAYHGGGTGGAAAARQDADEGFPAVDPAVADAEHQRILSSVSRNKQAWD